MKPRHVATRRSGPAGALARLANGQNWVRGTAAVLASLALVTASITAAQSAPGDIQLLVNSLEQTADANPGDGVCADANGVCTLRAAIHESNTLNGAAGEVHIGVDPGFAGGRINLVATTSTWMRTTAVTTGGSITGDTGAVFEVTAPVVIDLEHKVTAAPVDTLDGPGAALFYLNGPDITVTGVDNSYTGETTFYVGPSASNVTITGGSITTPNNYAERFLVVRGGASDIAVSDYTVKGYGSSEGDYWGWGFVDGATTAATAVKGLSLTGMTYDAAATGSCTTSSSAGCSSAVLRAQGQYVTDLSLTESTVNNLNRASSSTIRMLDLRTATITHLTVSDNTITNPFVYVGASLIDLGVAGYGANMTDITITNNVMTSVGTSAEEMNGVIRFPGNKSIAGAAIISGNSMTGSSVGMHAIYWDGPYSDAVSVASSGVVIQDNHFDGFGYSTSRSTIRMYQTGAVTVQRNTFGTASITPANTVWEEGQASGSYDPTMLSNWSYGANGKMNTWFPTARTSANVQASALVAKQCTIDLEIAPASDAANTADLTAARYNSYPATVDIYWTAGTTAEVYLQSVQVTSATRTTVSVALPLSGDTRLAHLPDGATLPVNATTGAVSGGLRVQTQDPNAGATTASSQYSRVATISGNCMPELTINQAATQNDPTLARDLHYTVTSSVPLDVSTLTAGDIGLSAVATADTIDAARINPRVVSVTEVEGSNGMVFDVVVRVDDSATVTATLAANTVSTPAGLGNATAATSTDNQITFTNPLVVTPAKFTLILGEELGKDYRVGLRTGAPTPTAALDFIATVDSVGEQYGVELSTDTLSIQAYATTSGAVNVTAAQGDVAANTKVTIAHTVTSADSNYDGLVAPYAYPYLFSTDPTIQIEKTAYIEVGDSSSPAQIEATGTQVLAGARVIDGQAACFVYTVTNISADDWATTLTGATITDTDTRLGSGGVIGTIPSLGIGQSVKLSACATLLSIDTTVSAGS